MLQTSCGPNFPAAILTVDRHAVNSEPMSIEGQLPEDLQGHIFILAAAGFVNSQPLAGTDRVLPSADGTPLISGDGMIFRLDFHKRGQTAEPGRVFMKTRIVGTPSYWADKAIFQKETYADLKFYCLGWARISQWVGIRNVVNTSWLSMKLPDEASHRLFVTFDAGRAYEIDPESLEVVTPLGWNKEWVHQIRLKLPFPLIMSSAHPYFDPRTNEVFTVNYTKSLKTIILSSFKYKISTFKEFVKTILDVLHWTISQLKRLIKWKGKFSWVVKKLIRTAISAYRIFRLSCRKPYLGNLVQLIRLGWQMLTEETKLQDVTYVVRWDGKGYLERWKLVNPDGTPVVIQQTLHHIGVTKDYIVLMETSLKMSLSQLIQFKNQKLDKLIREYLACPQSPDSNIYIIPRDRLVEGQRPATGDATDTEVLVQKLTIPREGFHFHVNYDNPDDRITLHAIHACGWDVGEWLRPTDTPLTDNPCPPIGMLINGMDINQMGRYEICGKTGQLTAEPRLTYCLDYTWAIGLYAYSNVKSGDTWLPPGKFENIYLNSYGAWQDLMPEFIDKLYADYPYREIPVEKVRQMTATGIPSSLCRLDVQQMEIVDGYQFPAGYFANSPQFVPRANGTGGSTDGYLTCTVNYNPDYNPDNDCLDGCDRLKAGKSEIWIFDASNLQGGPLCKLSHPHLSFAFTTHTTWLTEIAPRQEGLYCISIKQDHEEIVNKLALGFPKLQNKIKAFFAREVYSRFPQC
ncbi:carotenoid oxygenase family protein [Microseira wollei]|uniref:Lignostilbene-alpha,beta-dioxygenase n=1 Tax=Microseira wollei NIES-4236 TaxID=2530354 RepID=A0AAV3XEW1_9CYAN|nr:carotenoid oxygenase family protein [Microseira wollei]GET40894.1 hypothetical protein MiSe_57060 [Microseira wollei NIES-4236]